MIEALESLDLSKKDELMLKTILFQERTNKDREWDDEAVRTIDKLINENGISE